MLVDSTDGYKERHHAAFLEKLKNPGTSVLTSIKSQSERLAVAQATVATYLLGEFRDFESLPFLLEVYRDDRNGSRSPVPRVLVFAVMDQLTRFHPTGLLSPESRVLRKAYLTATKDLPRGYPHVVPTVAGEWIEEDLGEVTLTVYPNELTRFEVGEGFIREDREDFAAYVVALEKFIGSAYPNYKPKLK
jgi:hypothetical protein